MNLSAAQWDLIAAYLAVCRHGSLSAAARVLRCSQPTVRRQIETLETSLGVSLFTRSAIGLEPTAAARMLIGHAQAMEAAAGAFSRTAARDLTLAEGVVRLTCSDVFGVEIIPPILASIARDHPAITTELVLTNRTEDLLQREADIAVRLVRPTQGALMARKVRPVALGFHVAPGPLAARLEEMDYATFVREGPFIGNDRTDAIARGFAALGIPLPQREILRTDSDVAQLAAIRAGVGAGICQSRLAAASGLRRLFPQIAPSLDCWVVMHEDLASLRRVRIVFDRLVEAFLEA